MTPFHLRMWRASLLDAELYEEVEADRGATLQALAVVLLSAVGAGIGSLENAGLSGIFATAVSALVGWWVWAWVTLAIGTRLLPGPETAADHGELLRTLGFSSAPGVLRALGVVPGVAGPVFLVCGAWMGISMVVAVRQALDYRSTLRAVAVCAIGFPIYALFLAISLLWLGPWPI